MTSLNARNAKDLGWENIKGLLIEEYMKRKEKNEKQKPDDALFTRKGPSVRGRSHTRGSHFGNSRTGSRDCKSSSYSRGHQEQPNEGQREVRGPKCLRCSRIGHVVKNCPLNKRNSVNIAENSERSESQGFESDDVALSSSTNDRTSEWFSDSAATKHMTYNRSLLMDFIQYKDPLKIYLGVSTVVLALSEGKVRLPTCDDPDNVFLALHKVLFVPKLTKNLLSVPAMAQMGAEVRFDKEKCILMKDNKQYNIGHVLDGKLYRVNTPEYAQLSATSSAPSLELWHCRLGHLNYNYVDCVVKKELVHGMKFSNDNFDKQCEACTLGKMHKLPVPQAEFE